MKNKPFRIITVLSLLLTLLLGIVPAEVSAAVPADDIRPIQVVGGENHTVVLYSDGTVAAIGDNSKGQCNVSTWQDIIFVDAGFNHTLGVRTDGTVVATGDNDNGQCNVGTWKDIVQVAGGEAHTVGLHSDGTVETTGGNVYHQCELDHWTGITQVAASKTNSLGLTADHQVAIRGTFTTSKDFRVGGWKDIVSMTTRTGYIAGLKADGTVVGTGRNTDPEGRGNYSDISVTDWQNIRQVVLGRCNAFGLTEDGHVLCSGRNDFGQMTTVQGWSRIISLGAGLNHVIGIRENGTLVAAGDNSYGKCDVNQLYPNSQMTSRPSAFLNELPCSAVIGKVWTRSDTPTPANFHTAANAPGCWSDWKTPGHTSGPVRDNRGNLYTYGLHVDGSKTQTYSISFQLDGQYSTFTGVCGYPENVISPQYAHRYSKYFQVYGDGVLLYTSPTMNVNTDPVPFEVSIRNVNVLTISYPGTEGPNEAATLFDPMVQ